MEAANSGIATIFCITEGIPVLDMIPAAEQVRRAGARLIGPNCPGATSPGRAKVGIIPGSVHREGRVGVVSRSGTLTYEAVQAMTDAGLGQSTCVGIGGDPIIGTTFLDVLQLFAADDETDAIVLIGEIGGAAEETAAAWAADHLRDIPKVAFIAGRTAPEGKRMGHAGRDHLGRCRHGRLQGGRPRGGRVPRGRLAHRAPGAPSGRRLPRLGPAPCTSTTSGSSSSTTVGRPGGSSTPRPDVDETTWSAPNAIGERGLGGILIHHLGAHQRWRHGLSGSEDSPRPEHGPLPSPTELAEWWEAEWRRLDAWLDTIVDAWLITTDEGIPFWQMLAHVVNHGTQHRAEAAALLTRPAGRRATST